MYIKRLLFSICLSFLATVSYGQGIKRKFPPVIYNIKDHADTTFILRFSDVGGILNLPKFYFLSKKDSLINIYYMGNPLKDINMPKSIASTLKGLALQDTTSLNINLRFSPQPLNSAKGKEFWSEIMNLKPWSLKSDFTVQECIGSNFGVYDGILITFFIITKESIIEHKFYNPSIYEENCPSNIHRNAILKIARFYKQFFGF